MTTLAWPQRTRELYAPEISDAWDRATGLVPRVGTPPELPAYRSEDRAQLAVWCTHCHRWHRHGACNGDCDTRWRVDRRGNRVRRYSGPCTCRPGSGDGHRSAHCTCRHGFSGAGYVLREIGPLTPDVLAQHGRELSYARGCRWESCRFDRLVERRMRRRSWTAPMPIVQLDDPFEVLGQLVDAILAGPPDSPNADLDAIAAARRQVRACVALGELRQADVERAVRLAAARGGWPPDAAAVLVAAIGTAA